MRNLAAALFVWTAGSLLPGRQTGQAAELGLERDLLRPGEVLTVRLPESAEEGDELVWKDDSGVLLTKALPPGASEFRLPVSLPRSFVNRVVVLRGGRELSRAEFVVDLRSRFRKGRLRVFVPDLSADQAGGEEAQLPGGGSSLARESFDAVLVKPGAPGGFGRAAIFLDLDLLRDLSISQLFDPQFRGELLRKVREAVRSLGADSGRVGLASLGEIKLPGDVLVPPVGSEHFRESFGRFLKRRYGKIEKLKREWPVEAEGWENVLPPPLDELASPLLPGSPGFPLWADYLEFVESETARFVNGLLGELARVLPGASAGFFGMDAPTAGCDPGPLAESAGLRGSRRWHPGARTLVAALGGRRVKVAGWRRGTEDDIAAAASRELVRLFGRAEADLPGVAPGLGRLFELAGAWGHEKDLFVSPRVALVYSRESVWASSLLDALEGHKGPGSWARAWEGWCALLDDAGVPFDVLTGAEVEAAELRSGRHSIAVLVRALAVPKAVADELKVFARSGGVVLADCLPGLFDGHLRRSREGVLKDLFGLAHESVRFSEVGSTRRAVARGRLSYRERPARAGWFPRVTVLGVGPAEVGIRPCGAEPAGSFGMMSTREAGPPRRASDVPCLAVSSFGGGWGVALNLPVSAYAELRALPGTGRGLRETVAAVLGRARVSPPVRIRGGKGVRPPPRARLLDLGGAALLVVSREATGKDVSSAHDERSQGSRQARDEAAAVAVTLPGRGPYHVYDSTAGVYLGKADYVSAELAPGTSRVYGALPYRVLSVEGELLGPVPGERPFPSRLALAVKKEGSARTGFHIVEVEVVGPAGRTRPLLGGLVELPGGRGEFVIPFGDSEPAGLWTLRLTDAITGVTSIRRFLFTSFARARDARR